MTQSPSTYPGTHDRKLYNAWHYARRKAGLNTRPQRPRRTQAQLQKHKREYIRNYMRKYRASKNAVP